MVPRGRGDRQLDIAVLLLRYDRLEEFQLGLEAAPARMLDLANAALQPSQPRRHSEGE